MKHVSGLSELRECIADWKTTGKTIALVPTMGNLHGGHLSLLHRARQIADRSVVSIFINPIQFGKGEDYEKYPSTLDEDRSYLQKDGADLLFTPDLAQLYPGGTDSDSRINVPELSDILCGKYRPGHFSGVATVVAKLFINIQPDYALFGEKDYQQVLIIKRMVHDLCMPVDIIAMPTVREHDGLAMSSRNVFLTGEHRGKAPLIYRTLTDMAERLRTGQGTYAELEHAGRDRLDGEGFRTEYVSIRRSVDLAEPVDGDRYLSILIAAWLGKARLIDNIKVVID